MQRIFLIGYMGSGKSTIAKMLANRLGIEYIDMDLHIEQKQFKSVAQLFSEIGEEKFRLLEQQCLHEVSEFENVIISTGGGAPCFFDNMQYMNTRGLTVYLKLSADELAERLEHSHAGKRPLLADRKGKELQKFISGELAKREPYYSQATISVNGNDDEILSKICEYLS